MRQSNLGTLYMVATPIGNLEDITLRALRILKEVNFIACEDTRVSGKLLKYYNINAKLISLHSHSKEDKYEVILNKLINGDDIAYITDAGTPGISDPGQALIIRVRQSMDRKNQTADEKNNNRSQKEVSLIKIIPIPGPSAITTAISVSNLVNKEFYFAGFLPKKKGRQTKFHELKKIEAPIVIYESALRLERTLGDIREHFGENTEVFIAREMTKMFEEYWGGKIEEVLAGLSAHKIKGEIVLIVKRK